MARPWRVLDGADFTRDDRCSPNGARRPGMYARTVPRSRYRCVAAGPAGARPVLHGAAGEVRGLLPGLFARHREHHDYLTWAVLKAHTSNRPATVTLRSADPRDTPEVDFRYFEEGERPQATISKAVVTALRFVRRMTADLHETG